MKILCDVCGKGEASLFCCADEAVLCDACDRRVHRANKLAGKHRRFSLVRPDSPLLGPRCDVCQEKRAFLFCQEDRAILCKNCDGSIHSANELTKKHSRFLLTGVKLSAEATTPPAVETDSTSDVATNLSSTSTSLPEESAASGSVVADAKKKRVGQQPPQQPPAQAARQSDSSNSHSVISSEKVAVVQGDGAGDAAAAGGGDNSSSGAGSSISDYLMKTLPGWHVEDLLDFSSYYSSSIHTAASSPFKTQMVTYDDFQPFLEADLDARGAGTSSTWSVFQVPQVPPTATSTIVFNQDTSFGGADYLQQQSQLGQHHYPQQQRWNGDDVFAVPQIISQLPPSGKRARGLWYS